MGEHGVRGKVHGLRSQSGIHSFTKYLLKAYCKLDIVLASK